MVAATAAPAKSLSSARAPLWSARRMACCEARDILLALRLFAAVQAGSFASDRAFTHVRARAHKRVIGFLMADQDLIDGYVAARLGEHYARVGLRESKTTETSQPNSASLPATNSDVRCSSKPSSGCACRSCRQ